LSRTSFRTELALWLVLLAGFSPVIVQFLRVEAWFAPPTTLVAPVLIAILVRRGVGVVDPPRPAGVALIVVGLVLEVAGIALRTWTVAWLGFPVAAVGMALWLGRPSWRVAVLALGLVQLPESLRAVGSPAPESALISGVCGAWRAVGLDFDCIGPIARFTDRQLDLQPADVGWALAPLLAQLGWFLAVMEGASWWRALLRAAAFAAAVVVVQPLSIGLALGLLVVSSQEVARAWLSHGAWATCTIAAVAVASSGRRARTRRRTSSC
jgi:hypothetical protein